jgi:hypothetical protein
MNAKMAKTNKSLRIQRRNKQIKAEFWNIYQETPGRHYARIEVAACRCAERWFLSPGWIKRIAGPYPD